MARAARRIAGLVCVSSLTIALASAWMEHVLPTGAPVQVPVDESRLRVDELRPQGIRRGFATELSIRGAALSGNPRLVAPFRFVEKTAAPSGSDATRFRTRLTVDRDTPLGVYPVRVLFEASYESSVAEAFGNLRSSPAYLSPAFLKAEPSSMNFRC
jgi:hypothetical protein